MNKAGGRRVLLWAAVAAVCLVAGSIVAYTYYAGDWSLSGSGAPATPNFQISNATGDLNGMFYPGSIQGMGSNSTAILALGVSLYNRPAYTGLPLLADLSFQSGSIQSTNDTSLIASYFKIGSLFTPAWNGSAWLLTGQAKWGNVSVGEVVSMQGGIVTNLSYLVSSQFIGGGIWAAAWNGSAWLIGGDSATGAVLLSMRGNSVTNLSGLLPGNQPLDWIQLLAWNGSAWLIAGHGVLGTITGGGYTDILGQTVFQQSGVFAAVWDGTGWIFGGGPPAAVELYSAGIVTPLDSLPAKFNDWVNGIIQVGNGLLVGGKGSLPGAAYNPELVYLPSVTHNGSKAVDLTGSLPSAFEGGQIQSMISSPPGTQSFYLLAGQGNYNDTTGHGTGALAEVTVPSSTAVSYAGFGQLWNLTGTAEGRH